MNKFEHKGESREYKFFSTLVAIYVTLGVTSVALGYKLIPIGSVIVSGAALILPLRYLVGGLMADIYPLHLAKRQMWNLLLSCFVFSLVSQFIINLPSPADWNHQDAYEFVLGNGLRITTVAALGVIMGISINIFIVKKLGAMFDQKVFGIRVFIATACGELAQYAIALPMIFWGVLSIYNIFMLIICDFLVQLGLVAIFVPFFSIARYFIKEAERNIIQDKEIVFNPFKLDSK
ncbi:MAG: VUT family protein [Gammaproteobacteria bacterium]|nr:VUT family protein [Gammaproteobacteria bacterium]